MNNNIYDTANQLERELRNNQAYLDLKAAIEAIHENETSSALFKEFRDLSQQLQYKQMQGESLSEEESEQIQALSKQVQADDLINRLMLSEQQVSTVINDINTIITRPLNELYQSMN